MLENDAEAVEDRLAASVGSRVDVKNRVVEEVRFLFGSFFDTLNVMVLVAEDETVADNSLDFESELVNCELRDLVVLLLHRVLDDPTSCATATGATRGKIHSDPAAC